MVNSNNYQVFLNNPVGVRLADMPFSYLDLVRVEKQLGKLIIDVPLEKFFLISEYCQLEVWRSVAGGRPYLEGQTLWTILNFKPGVNEQGEQIIRIIAVDAILFLIARIVAYYSGQPQTKKTGFAGNVIKEIASENISSTANDYTGLALGTRGLPASLFSIQPNLNDGVNVDLAFAWQNCLDTFNDIADMSTTGGIYLGFDVVYDGLGSLELRTYANQRGIDHSTINPILLSPDSGNLGATSIDFNYLNESTFIYAGGQDTGTNRKMAYSFDAARLLIAPAAHREKWQDARQVETLAQVQDAADAALRAGKGFINFASRVIDNPNFLWGRDYNFGDIVPCSYLKRYVLCRLSKYHLTVQGAAEKVDVTLQSVA